MAISSDGIFVLLLLLLLRVAHVLFQLMTDASLRLLLRLLLLLLPPPLLNLHQEELARD